MKKLFCRILGVLLVLCLCMGLAACGSNGAASGLGTLTMDDDEGGGDGIGTLGEPTGSTPPGEPDGSEPSSPDGGDAAFSSTEQDFSFLYDGSYSARWDDESGATVYTEKDGSIPYITVLNIHRGDTDGFDITEYFYFDIEEIKAELGASLISASDMLTLTVDEKKVPGVLYNYTENNQNVEMFRLLDDTGDSLMLYTARYILGEGGATMEALVRAISTLKLDAGYYADGGGTGTPPAPQKTPAPAALSTEPYECEYFTLTKPSGWEVFYEVIDVGGGAKRLCTFVYDPVAPDNMFFFVQAIEQFYVSESSKQAWLPYLPAYYCDAPVLDGEPTAEATLTVWGNVFSVMSAEGSKSSAYFRNYGLTEVIESKVLNSSATTGTASYVLGRVTIPGASEQSLMFYQNTLVLMDPPTGLPASAQYYVSHSNLGVVLQESRADSQFGTVLDCLNSFDPTAFANRNNAKSYINGGAALPETDVSTLY